MLQLLENMRKYTEDIVLCNGVFDVLTLVQNRMPAICVPDLQIFREYHIALFEQKRVFICLGNDESGRRESKRIELMLRNVARETYIVDLPESIKDINELFMRAQNPLDTFLQIIQLTIKDSLHTPVAPDNKNTTVYLEEYIKRYRGVVTGVSTGFSELDKALQGGFRNGLYMFAGPVSSGKSVIMKQIADYIASCRIPVVYATWEMTNYELWVRSIASIMKIAPEQIFSGKVDPHLINKANKVYGELSKMLWTLECDVDTSLAEVETYIEQIGVATGRFPIIFIDDLQRISAVRIEPRVQQTQSAVVYALKQWSRKWNCTVVTASILEEHQKHPTGEENSLADVIIALRTQSDSSNKTSNEVSQINLELIKNRNGSLANVSLLMMNDQSAFID